MNGDVNTKAVALQFAPEQSLNHSTAAVKQACCGMPSSLALSFISLKNSTCRKSRSGGSAGTKARKGAGGGNGAATLSTSVRKSLMEEVLKEDAKAASKAGNNIVPAGEAHWNARRATHALLFWGPLLKRVRVRHASCTFLCICLLGHVPLAPGTRTPTHPSLFKRK